ncbi:STAS domain-containing protein [Streptomyces sp. NRRL B-1347]|uniref:STAS domain-containing protein n=1 Tax=Streptomyces sp. NRRL B-1347 TaxID=1476877 RepID=UPI00068F3EC7|nr:STAS domain-containing protein [Streptomyces sp. NRRL B-1347]
MEWSQPSESLRLAVVRVDGRVVIRVAGELDVSSASVLARTLDRAREACDLVALDLSRVTFCGAAGVDLLLDAQHQAAAAGGGLTVTRAHSAVLRPLEMCGGAEAARLVRGVRTASLAPHEHRRRCSLLSETLSVALRITGAPMGNAQLLDPAVGALRIIAQQGFHQPFLRFFETVDDRDTACGVAAQDHKPVFVDEVAHSPVFLGTPALDALQDADVGAVASVPVLSRAGALIGVVSVHYQGPVVWRDDRRQALEGLARASCLI